MASDPSNGARNQAIPSTTAVPDSNTLLAYKLLQDSWATDKNDPNAGVFKDLMRHEMKYLVSGVALLQNDPYLQVKLGGISLNNAGYIASALKQKVAELELSQRIEPSAQEILSAQYGTEKLFPLRPKAAAGTISADEGILNIAGSKVEPLGKLVNKTIQRSNDNSSGMSVVSTSKTHV